MVITTDYANKQRHPENEPYSTLASYRTLPSHGIAFGGFYKTEVLDNETYNQLLSQDLGYPDHAKIEEIYTRKGDSYSYVKVSVGDELKIRLHAKNKWVKNLKTQ